QAWAAALFLTFLVLVLSLLAKALLYFGTLNPLKWKIKK
ncbi:MAG: phosphate ABC transporter, permease protein PstA, partial [Thermodesulfobacterium geofontis]